MGVVEEMTMHFPAIFSDYIVYVDESGDHGLKTLDPQFPVFALCFCIFKKEEYLQHIVPAVQRLKFDFFGHDQVVLHERDIRLAEQEFTLLRTNKELRLAFHERLNQLIDAAPMTVIASVINKTALLHRYDYPPNPYALALRCCINRCVSFLEQQQQQGRNVHLIVESRGKNEDAELKAEFLNIVGAEDFLKTGEGNSHTIEFTLKFAHKRINSAGLQLADLMARPIALKELRPTQPNRAFDILSKKFPNGLGMKSLPL